MAMNNLFTYDEFYYRTTRPGKVILDPYTGEATEWEEDETEEEGMMERVLQQQPWLQIKKVEIPTVKLVIQLSGKVVYHGANLLNIDAYPFVPCQCYIEQDIQAYAWRKRGTIRNMRDAQFLGVQYAKNHRCCSAATELT